MRRARAGRPASSGWASACRRRGGGRCGSPRRAVGVADHDLEGARGRPAEQRLHAPSVSSLAPSSGGGDDDDEQQHTTPISTGTSRLTSGAPAVSSRLIGSVSACSIVRTVGAAAVWPSADDGAPAGAAAGAAEAAGAVAGSTAAGAGDTASPAPPSAKASPCAGCGRFGGSLSTVDSSWSTNWVEELAR